MEDPEQPSRQDVPIAFVLCSNWDIPILQSDWVRCCLDASGPLYQREFVISVLLACFLVSPDARKLKKVKVSMYSQTNTKKLPALKLLSSWDILLKEPCKRGFVAGVLWCSTPVAVKKRVQNGSRNSARLHNLFWLPKAPEERHYFFYNPRSESPHQPTPEGGSCMLPCMESRAGNRRAESIPYKKPEQAENTISLKWKKSFPQCLTGRCQGVSPRQTPSSNLTLQEGNWEGRERAP